MLTVIGIVIGIIGLMDDGDGKKEPPRNDPWRYPYYPYSPPRDKPDEPEKPYYPPPKCDSCDGSPRTYVIGIGSDWGSFDWLDDSNQCAASGWNKAIIEAACKAAYISCEVVVIPYGDCINSLSVSDFLYPPVLGKALGQKSVDACSGWFPTTERSNIVLFSDSYLARDKHFLYYTSYTGAPSDIEKAKIGFVHGYPGDERCISRFLCERLKYNIKTSYLIPYSSTYNLIQALLDNEVDLIFSESRDAILSQHYGLTSLEIFDADQNGDSSEYDDGNTMYCSDDGGLVTHKANGDFIKCFNKGLYKIRANGEYKEICCASKYNPFYPTVAHQTYCI